MTPKPKKNDVFVLEGKVNVSTTSMKINGDKQPQLRQVVEALRNWIIERLKSPTTEVEKFVSSVFGPRLDGMPDMFDFQCFLCMCKEGLITWEDMVRQFSRLCCFWKLADGP